MAQPGNTKFREQWYESMLDSEEDPKKRFEILRSKLAADVKRLPEDLRAGTYEQASSAIQGVIEAIQDVLEDIGTRPPSVRALR